jgi:hypothetical protein
MLNYSDIKSYWTKFAQDMTTDVKSAWENYFKTVESFYKK